MRRIRYIILSVLTICFIIILSACSKAQGLMNLSGDTPSENYTGGIAMDTVFEAVIYDDKPDSSALIELADTLDTDFLSRYTGSYISRYNEGEELTDLNACELNAGELSDEPLYVDLQGIIHRCDEIGKASDGAFDIRLGALSDLWDIDAAAKNESVFILPSEEEIRDALNDKSVTDLGSVGKGIYLDIASQLLAANDTSCALINAGGSILTYGNKPDGSLFKIGIKGPSSSALDTGNVIEIGGGWFISTSSGNERFAELEGERYIHILNPQTGYPAWSSDDMDRRGYDKDTFSYPVSVTVISRSGLESDALSTACFVLGAEDGVILAEKYDAEVIFILSNGSCITSGGIEMIKGDKCIFKLNEVR